MRPKSNAPETPSERLVRDIRRATRKQYSAEEKIRIVLDGLRRGSMIRRSCCTAPELKASPQVQDPTVRGAPILYPGCATAQRAFCVRPP